MSLSEQVDKRRREIRTDGYPMSIGEWISMYKAEELDIHPEFQRFFRWTEDQKTALIESILLGIPLPSIFVSQRKDGVWDVIDGLQRLSTIFQFVGILKDEKGKKQKPLVLKSTKYLPELENTTWSKLSNSCKPLSSDLQLIIKRSKISSSIVLKESDENTKYDLFQRLNTGGSVLSPQEVRNCMLVMVNRQFFNWMGKFKSNENFINVSALSDRPLEQAYDTELALRFIVLSGIELREIKSVGDVGVFLTDQMITKAESQSFKKSATRKLFDETFNVLNRTIGDDAFRRYNVNKSKHEGGFLLSLFEVVALGIAYNISHNKLCNEDQIADKAKSLWSDQQFKKWAGSGVTASRRLPRLIPLGRELFQL